MAARLTRAKKKISVARIPFRVPEAAELPDRLRGVLGVIHLLFTTGHTAPSGSALVRTDLTDQALHLARMLVVALNRTVALAEVAGPGAALAEVEAVARDGRLAGYQYLPAIRGGLLRRLGRTAEASVAYRDALALTSNQAEREFLTGRLRELTGQEDPRGRSG